MSVAAAATSWTGTAGFADTSWEGKHLGKLATLAGIAEVAGDAALQPTFLTEIKRRLENWLTASPGEDSPLQNPCLPSGPAPGYHPPRER